jgi:HAD superfamily hydrolase (TIGR01509 family)
VGGGLGPDAVVFDLDGVLVDSEPAWDAARRAVIAESGGRWKEGATRAMMGMSSPEWSRYMSRELGAQLDPGEINERVVATLLAEYEANGASLLAGAYDAVRELAAHWPLGLASSANRGVIDTVLAAVGLVRCFAATVSAEEVARGKPAGDVYLAAAAALGVEPARAVAVEDSSNGLRAAAAAGLAVIAVPNASFPPTPDALELASVVIGSLTELTPAAVRSAAGSSAAQRVT